MIAFAPFDIREDLTQKKGTIPVTPYDLRYTDPRPLESAEVTGPVYSDSSRNSITLSRLPSYSYVPVSLRHHKRGGLLLCLAGYRCDSCRRQCADPQTQHDKKRSEDQAIACQHPDQKHGPGYRGGKQQDAHQDRENSRKHQ